MLPNDDLAEQNAAATGLRQKSVSTGRSRTLLLFSAAALSMCFLHLQSERSVRGSIPPDSDSLSYQNNALNDLYLWQRGKLSLYEFCFGSASLRFLPPLHKWSLEAGYLVFGINNLSPYAVSAIWLFLAGLALFLSVRYVTGNEFLAAASGLALLATPAALNFGFMSSRNDWPVTALSLTGFYWLITSELFKNRARCLVAGLFWGLATLVKSSVFGYLFLPVLALAAGAIARRRHIARSQVVNAILAGFVMVMISGWFYAHAYRDVIEYYTFWSSTNLANVLSQYQLHTVLDQRLFYVRNLWLQLGPPASLMVFSGLGLLAGMWWPMRYALSNTKRYAVTWGACFAFLPYGLLIYRRSFASIADINMIPFLIFVGAVGWWFLSNAVGQARSISAALLCGALLLNLGSALRHQQARLYQAINADKAARAVAELLMQSDYRSLRPRSLNQDIYFNAGTLLHVLYRDPVYREQFNVSLPDPSLQATPSPSIAPKARYASIVKDANVLLVSDRPKGFSWIPINQQWEPLRRLVQADRRFSLLGKVEGYDDNTCVEVYAKEALLLETEADGWVPNGATLKVFSKPGVRTFTVEGISIGQTVTDLSLIGNDEETIAGVPTRTGQERQFKFEVPLLLFSSPFRLRSNSPAVPARLANSSDRRELLLSSPRLSFVAE